MNFSNFEQPPQRLMNWGMKQVIQSNNVGGYAKWGYDYLERYKKLKDGSGKALPFIQFLGGWKWYAVLYWSLAIEELSSNSGNVKTLREAAAPSLANTK